MEDRHIRKQGCSVVTPVVSRPTLMYYVWPPAVAVSVCYKIHDDGAAVCLETNVDPMIKYSGTVSPNLD